jgi:hypothetical protein
VELKPFQREEKEMTDTRWLTVLGDNTAIFGTPVMVMRALDRYLSSSATDGALVKRMMTLRRDVNCWSILALPGAVLARHLPAGVVGSSETVLRGVSNVTVGVHYGSGIHGSGERVDFSIGTNGPEAATALAAAMDGRSHLMPIADTLRARLAAVSVEQNEVRGSVRVKDKEFDSWLAAVYARLSVDRGLGGENVARVCTTR